MALIFKILADADWKKAVSAGVYLGSAVDLADGFIHFSDAAQLRETARRYFSAQHDLLLVVFESADLGDALKWEASRGGALFPHLYCPLDPTLALWSEPLPWRGEQHVFPGSIS